MRLVVSGYYGFGNAGDDAVLTGLLELLAGIGIDGREVSVLSANPERTRRAHHVRSVSRWNPFVVATELRRSDGLISGGGGLLQDVTSVRPVTYYAGVMHLARTLRRPYAVLAQGLGPIRRAPNRRITRVALDAAAYLSFRDDQSVALARRMGVRRPIHRVADLALAAMPPGVVSSGARNDHVVVAVRGGFPADTVVGPLRDVVAELARSRRVVAIAMHPSVDRDASTAVVAGIRGASLADPEASLAAKLQSIGTASLVIGVRLHSLVLGAAAGVPGVAISYDTKVEAFAERAGIPVVGRAGSILEPKSVLAAIDRTLKQDREPYLARVAEMRREAESGVRDAIAALSYGSHDVDEDRSRR